MNLKKQLEKYLHEHGMSTLQLSRKSGVPNATLADWVTGRKPRNLDQVKKVADVFKVSIDQLVYGDGIDKKETISEMSLPDEEGWIGGVFEVKFRKINRRQKND